MATLIMLKLRIAIFHPNKLYSKRLFDSKFSVLTILHITSPFNKLLYLQKPVTGDFKYFIYFYNIL